MQYALTITAVGEVRDAEGNLISAEPVEATTTITQEQYDRLMGHQEEN